MVPIQLRESVVDRDHVRERSFASVVRTKVLLAIVPIGALTVAAATAIALNARGYAAVATALSLGAAWVAFLYRDEMWRRSDVAHRYVIGFRSERLVQHDLSALPDHFFVKNDLSFPGGGNIDHMVCGPTGAFAIDSKTRTHVERDLGTARRRAKWLSTQLDDHWVTPVICEVEGRRAPFRKDGVWIVCGADLREWVQGRRDKPIDPVLAMRRL
jgi:hypothetical protein